jgi:hypothetical protein
MSVLVLETYQVDPDKDAQFGPRLQEFLSYKDSHPEVFPALRSWKLFRQRVGAGVGSYLEMWEYDDVAAVEEGERAAKADEGMRAISAGFHELLQPGTFATSVWNQVA